MKFEDLNEIKEGKYYNSWAFKSPQVQKELHKKQKHL